MDQSQSLLTTCSPAWQEGRGHTDWAQWEGLGLLEDTEPAGRGAGLVFIDLIDY